MAEYRFSETRTQAYGYPGCKTAYQHALPVPADRFKNMEYAMTERSTHKQHSTCGTLTRTVLLISLVLFQAGCGPRDQTGENTSGGTVAVITVWAHHGKPAEWQTITDQVDRFNRTHQDIRAELIEIAESNYDTQVQSAAADRELPDVLEFDGPMLANYAWKGYLTPIGDELNPSLVTDLIESIKVQGTYADKLYAVGTFDSGLGLYADKSKLEETGARIPGNWQDAWTVDEWNSVLDALAKRESKTGGDGQVLDLKRDYRGEWWTYGFYPVLVSAGGDLIDREDYQSAAGVLTSTESVRALKHIRKWFDNGLVDPNTDGRAFIDRRVALSWVGHWEYPRYRKALGDDLVLLPLPDFGKGSTTGMGSWCWGISRSCSNRAAAITFLEFLLQPEEILAITEANGAVPATNTAIAQSADYQPGGPLHLFAAMLRHCAVPRPRTPAYPVITSAFQQAMLNIITGAPVEEELVQAARIIDRDIEEHDVYPRLVPEHSTAK